ncbi:hypothetical protein SAMN05428959_103254 [Duganella sp. CF517]|uniref:hypothetical protein n=1 Tax=Duganella sp. CF517 TaxID=1881038 RepID=UPI0008BC3788|nr:hypothetical protein [Duganella sp. CF517]SEN81423.1 hypothetical protein SAMN05428959_103254 [Duganella sp. CF517]
MSPARMVFEEFLRSKKSADAPKSTRQRYHAMAGIWTERYTPDVFRDLHPYILAKGWRPIGWKGTRKPNPRFDMDLVPSKRPRPAWDIYSRPIQDFGSVTEIWAGLYGSSDIEVAKGYLGDDGGEGGTMFRIYVKREYVGHNYKLPVNEGMDGEMAKRFVTRQRSDPNLRYCSLSGPQTPGTGEASLPETFFFGPEISKCIMLMPVPRALYMDGQNAPVLRSFATNDVISKTIS